MNRRLTIRVQLIDPNAELCDGVLGEASETTFLPDDMLRRGDHDRNQDEYIRRVAQIATLAYVQAFGRVLGVDPAHPSAMVEAVQVGDRFYIQTAEQLVVRDRLDP